MPAANAAELAEIEKEIHVLYKLPVSLLLLSFMLVQHGRKRKTKQQPF
jgi:cytochrome c-type biogenesis protein CcmH/NrfF